MWSQQEAAILLNGYMESLRGELPRSHIIMQVSADLRKMVVNNGFEMDDIFRNVSGITFQMMSMESAYCGRTITKPATQLFKDTVKLYNESNEEYERLLKEARTVIDGKLNYKNSFALWLSKTTSNAQINMLLNSCNIIEEYCLKLNILRAPLFESMDLGIIKSVHKTVSQNRLFRIVNRKQMKHIDRVMAYLLRYIQEGNIDRNVSMFTSTTTTEPIAVEKQQETPMPYIRTDQDRRMLEKYPLAYKRIFFALSENKERSVTITNLYERINHIARCADIEDILDNVSWSICEKSRYRFSEEISRHNESNEVTAASSKLEDMRNASDFIFVDFKNIGDYSHTKPISISYYNNRITNLASWTDAYVKLVARLYDDYSNIIPVGKSFSGSGRVDFGNRELARIMTAPKPIYMQMYLETNLSATNIVVKIKALLDICKVDYENVVVEYQKKSKVVARTWVATTQNSAIYSGIIDRNSFMAFLREHERMADATCRSYVSAISTAERFAKEHRFEYCKLFTSDWREAKATMDALFSDSVFINYNNQQHNRFRAAMNKLLVFLSTNPASIAPNGIPVGSTVQPIVDEKFLNVLMQNFRKGFRLGSPIELRKFKRCYEQMYEVVLEEDDATIERKICSCGIRFEDKAFVPQAMLGEDTRKRLFAYIGKSFDEGKTALYYQALFNEFSEEFLDYFIYSADMLKEYLSYMLKDEYFFGRSYLSKEADAMADPIDELRTCLKEYVAPMTYDVIFENLPHIPQHRIKQILATYGEFVNNGRGKYFHVSAVHFSDEELDNIAGIITVAIENKDFLSGNELIDAIKSKYPYIYDKNNSFSVIGLRDAIKYHLCRKFSFSGNIISRIDSCLTMSDVFADYCRSRGSFTVEELRLFADELGTVIYFEPVYENALRISHDQFVSEKRALFNVPETDSVLDRFCVRDYVSIPKVCSFSLFPNAGFTWNEFLLESYVAKYSDNYVLFHTGFNADSCVGAIAKKSAGFESFDDCIIEILAGSDITLKKQDALQFLYAEGYIAQRRLSNIEELLIKATAQRNRKEAN